MTTRWLTLALALAGSLAAGAESLAQSSGPNRNPVGRTANPTYASACVLGPNNSLNCNNLSYQVRNRMQQVVANNRANGPLTNSRVSLLGALRPTGAARWAVVGRYANAAAAEQALRPFAEAGVSVQLVEVRLSPRPEANSIPLGNGVHLALTLATPAWANAAPAARPRVPNGVANLPRPWDGNGFPMGFFPGWEPEWDGNDRRTVRDRRNEFQTRSRSVGPRVVPSRLRHPVDVAPCQGGGTDWGGVIVDVAKVAIPAILSLL
jgi:hypothetical protein